MTATPQQIIPPLYFKTLCQNPPCKTPLGGFVPQPGVVVIFACQRCQHVSVFHSQPNGIFPFLLDRHGREVKTTPAAPRSTKP
jgi:hypothetical protein